MAKVSAPLLSFSAAGKLADSLVFFPWKGINAVRQYVVPSNPNSAAQATQRGYMTAVIAVIRLAQTEATHPLIALDVAAYNLLASCEASARTWWNMICQMGMDNYRASKKAVVFHGMVITPGAGQLAVDVSWDKDGANNVTAGDFWYGTSKTALLSSEAGVVAAGHVTATITGLATGTKYFLQFRPTAHNDFDDMNSGIYYGTPT